jgi:hypothetical protein
MQQDNVLAVGHPLPAVLQAHPPAERFGEQQPFR